MAKPILLFDGIDSDVSRQFIEELNETPVNDPVDIWINCPGAITNAGWSILAALNERGHDADMLVVGDASSFAFIMLPFARKTRAYETANFLIHRAASWWESEMSKEELKGIEDRNKLIRKKLEKRINTEVFEKITGKTFDDIFSMESRLDVTLNAKQAKQIGLIDEIVKLDVKKKKEIESRYFQEIAALSNMELKPKQENKMSKLKDFIFGSKDNVLIASIGNNDIIYTKIEKGVCIKPVGKDVGLITGTFETEKEIVSVVDNEITEISEIDSKAKEIEALKAEIKELKSGQITASDVKEVVDELTSQFSGKITALESVITEAKLQVSNPKIPKGEFKDDVIEVDERTITEKIAAEQQEMYKAKQTEGEAS